MSSSVERCGLGRKMRQMFGPLSPIFQTIPTVPNGDGWRM